MEGLIVAVNITNDYHVQMMITINILMLKIIIIGPVDSCDVGVDVLQGLVI